MCYKISSTFNAILHDIFVRTWLIQSRSTMDNCFVHVALQWLSGGVEGCIKQSSPGVSSECVMGHFNP